MCTPLLHCLSFSVPCYHRGFSGKCQGFRHRLVNDICPLLFTGRHFWNRKCRKKTWWQQEFAVFKCEATANSVTGHVCVNSNICPGSSHFKDASCNSCTAPISATYPYIVDTSHPSPALRMHHMPPADSHTFYPSKDIPYTVLG